MPRAGDHPEQLGGGVKEVEDLRNEEQQQSLAEVAQDPNHSKYHASKIAECVAHKHTRGVPEGWGKRGHRGEGGTQRGERGRTAHQLCLSKAADTAMKGRMRYMEKAC